LGVPLATGAFVFSHLRACLVSISTGVPGMLTFFSNLRDFLVSTGWRLFSPARLVVSTFLREVLDFTRRYRAGLAQWLREFQLSLHLGMRSIAIG